MPSKLHGVVVRFTTSHPPGGFSRARALGGAALLAAIVALHVAGYAFTTTITDTARDVGEAWRIVHEAAWPLRGPQIGQRWSLGPAWFYLLAPVVAFARSMTAVAWMVGALAAIKFGLAWQLGRLMLDARFGLLFAFVLALPGWASLEHVVFAHTNLAGTATLGFALAAFAAWRRPHAARYLLAGIALALALHAHPSAVLLAPAALLAAGAAPSTTRTVMPRLALLGLGFVLPFVPMLFAEAREGWPAFARSGEYLAHADFGARAARIPSVLAGTWVAPIVLVRDFLLPDVAGLRAGWVLGMSGLGMLALVGLARSWRQSDRATLLFAIAAVTATGAVALLRETIAFYLVLPALPLVAAAVALALRRAAPRHQAWLIGGVGVFALAANAALIWHRAEQAALGEQWLPRATLVDVARWPVPDPIPVDYLPVAYVDRVWVPLLCGDPAPVALHGDIAAQLELAQALPLVFGCDSGATLPLVGGLDGPGAAGFPVGLMQRAQFATPAHAYGHALLTTVTPVHPPRGVRLGLHDAYPPHPFAYALDEHIVIESRSGPSARLAITELNPAFVATADPRVRANGVLLVPIARSAATRIYHCVSCTTPVAWTLELESGELDWLDVFFIDTQQFPRQFSTARGG